MSPRIHLIEGPVGSGKSTIAGILSEENRAPKLLLDKWMKTLFSPDRPETNSVSWYIERKERCILQIMNIAHEILNSGSDVVLELGLIQQSLREQIYDLVEKIDFPMKIYVVDAPKEVRRQRVVNRNIEKGETYSMEVSEEIFEFANSMWESIDESECRDFEVEYISTSE